MSSEQPIVSICCLVYNHEPFLRDCFEGFVMQKTTFPIEILVHDDASTDRSADIIREYTEKYPDLFKPIYQKENQYSKGKGFVGMTLNFERAKGKYIAMCEGDDYWTDPLKLQKQVDFLEQNPKYSICFHDINVTCDGINFVKFDNRVSLETDIYDLAKWNYIVTLSVVYRLNSDVHKRFQSMGNLPISDYPLWLLNAEYGKIKKIPSIMAVYRKHHSGMWTGKSMYEQNKMLIESLLPIRNYYRDRNEKVTDLIETQIVELYSKTARYYYEENKLLLNSYTYKLGNFLLWPLKFILKKYKRC